LKEALKKLEAKRAKQNLDTSNQAKRVRYTSPQFHALQCEYLLDKLEKALKGASETFKHVAPSLEWSEILKALFVLAIEAESFIDRCSEEDWLGAAIMLTSVSEHISLIGSNLEALTNFLYILTCSSNSRNRQSLTREDVARTYEEEVRIVRKKAEEDEVKLKERVDLIYQRSYTISEEKYRMASFLHRKFQDLGPEKYLILSSVEGGIMRVNELEKLGTGPFAFVNKATWLGVPVAKKSWPRLYTELCKDEVSILAGLSHPNVMSLLCWILENEKYSIVMELMDEDLYSVMMRRSMTRKPPFPIFEAIDLMLQIAQGVCYLHEKKIAHNDLKSHNILVKHVKPKVKGFSEYLLAKVGDFGLASTTCDGIKAFNIGTTRWMAPEMIQLDSNASAAESKVPDKIDHCKLDVYSFGMVCYEILTANVPFATLNPREVKYRVLDGERPQLPLLGPGYEILGTLIEECWNMVPDKRPSFSTICVTLRWLKWSALCLAPEGNSVFRHHYGVDLHFSDFIFFG
jgi:hypothetical protein